jgi:hypothetical protein
VRAAPSKAGNLKLKKNLPGGSSLRQQGLVGGMGVGVGLGFGVGYGGGLGAGGGGLGGWGGARSQPLHMAGGGLGTHHASSGGSVLRTQPSAASAHSRDGGEGLHPIGGGHLSHGVAHGAHPLNHLSHGLALHQGLGPQAGGLNMVGKGPAVKKVGAGAAGAARSRTIGAGLPGKAPRS